MTSTPFLNDYLKVVAETIDIPADPTDDPGTSPEMIAFCFDAETQTLSFWDPVNEERISVAISVPGVVTADGVSFSEATYELGTDVQAAIEQVYSELLAIVGGEPGVSQNTFLVQGGQAVWVSDFDYLVSAATYYIDGILYSSAQQSVSLAAADPADPRIDVIAVDTAASVVVITGTPAPEPSKPDIDPGSQLELTFVLVPALATEPPDITDFSVYLENAGDPAEWDGTTSGAGFTLNSAVSPRTGAVCIDGTNVTNGSYAQFEKGTGTIEPNDYDFLVMYIQSKSTWGNNRGLQISFRDNGVLVGTSPQIRRTGTYGFVSSSTGSYQQIAIPIADFAVPQGAEVNQIRLTDFGGDIDFRIDDISMQGGGGSGTPVTGITQEFADARYLQIADADERAQDAVGAILVDGTTVNFTYNDGGPSITAEVQNIDTTHFAANIIDADDTLSANSDLRLATQQAVKAYVDAAVIAGGYTNEMAQDAVGGILDNTFDVKFVYDDGAPTIQASAVRVLQIEVFPPGEALTTGDDKRRIRINSLLNGWNLTAVAACVGTAPSGGTVTVQIHNVTSAADILSTELTIDDGELDSKDAMAAAVIDAGEDDVATGDQLRIDVDAANTAEGLIVELTFTRP